MKQLIPTVAMILILVVCLVQTTSAMWYGVLMVVIMMIALGLIKIRY
jgi:hypothetical protein